MDSERFERKQAELAVLQQEARDHPELFVEQSFVEDNKTLSEVGILIPGKESFPLGLLKLWPEDFIVEEKIDEGVRTVEGKPEESPGEPASTVYATLVKCNISTFEAVADMARALSIRVEDISFAGLKDKNALTSQKISIRRASPDALRALSLPYYFLKDFETGKGITERGRLDGNRFTILIRTEESFFDPERFSHFAEHLKRVKSDGFANFFYLQRFGTSRLRNFHWAWLILQGRYEDAVYDFLTYAGAQELPYFKNLRTSLKNTISNWDATYAAMEQFPIIFEQELLVTDYLRKHPSDFVGALNVLPEQITFWLYALSSLLFNTKISEYLARGERPPEKLPFFLSRDRADYGPYKQLLEKAGVYPPPFQNLKPFPQVMMRSRETPTQSHVDFRKAELTKEGIVFEFDLDKGQYATTMLSHLFNLVSGLPPTQFSKERIDSKAILKETSISTTIERFKDVIQPKGGLFSSALDDAA